MTNADARFAEATQLRPRRVGEIVDAAMQIWGRHWKVLTPLAAGLLFPFQLLSALVAVSVSPTLLETLQQWQKDLNADSTSTPHFSGSQFAAMGGSFAINYIGTFVLTAAVTAFVINVYLRRPADRHDAMRAALRRGPVMLLSSLLGALTVVLVFVPALLAALAGQAGLALLLLVVGLVAAFYLGIRLSIGQPSVVAEGAGAVQALRRSFRLTKGRFWPVLGITVLSALVTGIPASVLSAIVQAILRAAGGNNAGFDFVWTAIANTVGAAIMSPLGSAIAVILYFDLRIRREGFDLEQLSAQTAPPTGPPTALL